MLCPINEFRRALLDPENRFASLSDAVPAMCDGVPMLHRTALFAESPIIWHGDRYLVFLPLTAEAVRCAERAAAATAMARSPYLPDYRLLRGEMLAEDSTGRETRCDMVLQRMPEGESLAEAVAHFDKARLAAAVEAMREALHAEGIVHRNVKPENICITPDCRAMLLRGHYVARSASDDDGAAFDCVMRFIDRMGTTDAECAYAPAEKDMPAEKYHMHDGMVRILRDGLYGYADEDMHETIEPQFVYASDFREGRAEVETADGKMGLIDKSGRYVIAPEYEIVEFDPADGRSAVRLNGEWAAVDYDGRRICEYASLDEFSKYKKQ